jgi:hypothetical protein
MQQVYAKRKQKKAALIPRDIDPLRLFEQFRQFGVVALPALGRARGPARRDVCRCGSAYQPVEQAAARTARKARNRYENRDPRELLGSQSC